MQTISLGSFNIPWLFLPVILAWMVYRILTKRIYRKLPEQLKVIDGILVNIIFIIIIVWKMSPLLFQFSTVAENPSALLFLPGGRAGIITGVSAAAVFLGFSLFKRRRQLKDLVIGFLLNAVLLAAAFLIFGAGTSWIIGTVSNPVEGPAAAVGAPAYDFTLDAQDGKVYRLSDNAGRTVVLNFWASWCPPCRAELPELISFHEGLDPEGPVFLSINMYTTETDPSGLSAFVAENKLNFPVLYDKDGRIAAAYDIKTIPTTIIIDKNGMIHSVKNGAVTEAVLKRLSADAGE